MTYCSQVAISEMLRQLAGGRSAHLTDAMGHPLHKAKQIRILTNLQANGYEWYPCTNPDRTGRCMGHDIPTEMTDWIADQMEG